MPTSSEARKELLELFAVPTKQNVFVLGCFARHVTIYSQQVRTLNLIYTLHEEYGLNGKRVGIIGAGVAGLTAAGAALILGAKVTLLEKQPDVLTLQKANSTRWLHPNIYDWPFIEPDRDARLPILNWVASNSATVAGNLNKDWEAIAKRFEGFLDIHRSITALTVTESVGLKPVVEWSSKNKREFDVLIWAVGFGLEGTSPGESYWSPDTIETNFGPPEKCLVSGYGDGALTDLMRLCVKDFRQDEIIDLFANDGGTPSVIARIKQIETHADSGNDAWLTQEYESLNSPAMRDFLKRNRRPNRSVFVAGKTPWLYSKKSSPLNRFIVSQLQGIDAFTPLKSGPLEGYEQLTTGGWRASWADGSTELFDRIVVRHGPSSALPTDIRDLCESLRLTWDGMPPGNDRTRIPIWPRDYWEGKDAVVADARRLASSRPPATSMIDMVTKTMTNPRYKEDLARLDEHWKLDAVVGKQTVVIVVGSKAACELLDRPVAEFLRELIDKEGSGKTYYHRAVVFSDVVWLNNEVLQKLPLIAIGGPNGNDLTKKLLDANESSPDRSEWEMGEGAKGFFRKISKNCPQVALYGNSAARTRKAVEVYIEKQEGLQSFLDICWGTERKTK